MAARLLVYGTEAELFFHSIPLLVLAVTLFFPGQFFCPRFRVFYVLLEF